MSTESGENFEVTFNQASSLDAPSPHTLQFSEQAQSVDLLSVLNRVNDSIINSNKLIIQPIKDQGKQRCLRYVSDSDPDDRDYNEPPLKKKWLGVASATCSKSTVMPDLGTNSPSVDVTTIATPHDTNSPALLIAGHATETRPSADDVVSLFGEQDIDEEVNDPETDPISQDQFLMEVENAVSTAKVTGPPISEHLADIINKKFHVGLEPAQRKAIIDKYLVPEICSGLYRPRVNHEIWSSLRPSSKVADKSITMLQDALIAASSAVAISTEEMLKCREMKTPLDFQNIVSRQIDIITILGFISLELSFRRKEALRPSIAPEYKSACSRTTKPSMLLFGDDLPKVMQEVRTTNRLLHNNFSATRPYRRGGAVQMNVDSNNGTSFIPEGEDGISSRQKSLLPTKEKTCQELENVESKVSSLHSFLHKSLIPYLKNRVATFLAGQISQYVENWKKIPSDPYILNIVLGDTIEFVSEPPAQQRYPPNSISGALLPELQKEIKDLLSKGVITPSQHEDFEYVSPIFCVPKKDNKVRLILNLNRLNSFVAYHHFKMETIQQVLSMITPNCWMASIDLKDAYYSVRVHPAYQKYLKFAFPGSLYAYTAYPNGLASCPRQFTKVLKPPISLLRSHGHIVSSYIDDIYIQSDTYEGCVNSVLATFKEFDNLGFVIHPEKSEFLPKQQIKYLGFILDSTSMKITLPSDRKQKIKDCLSMICTQANNVLIRNVA